MTTSITGVILAGGQGRRMGGQDKGLVGIDGVPMVARVLARLAPQVRQLLINANRNPERYAAFGVPVIADDVAGFAGPLAGMASALRRCDTDFILSAPCDSPLLPMDLAARMLAALETRGGTLAYAHDGHRMQPAFALLPCRLAQDLEHFLAAGERKIDRWFARYHAVPVDFSDVPDAFVNVNTPEQAADLLRKISASPEEVR